MNIALSDTIFYVTGKQGIENTSQQELQNLVASYPYFAPAQLVYAAKLKSENSFKLQSQIQKAGLFFNNFKWLQFQLMEVNVGSFVSTVATKTFQQEESIVVEQKVEEPVLMDEEVVYHQALPQEEVISKEEEVHFAEPIETIVSTAFEHYDVAETVAGDLNDFMPNISIPTVEEVKGIMNGIDDGKEEIVVAPASENHVGESNIVAQFDEVIEPITEAEPIANEPEAVIENFLPVVEETVTNPVLESYETNTIEETIINPANDIHAEIAALKANWHINHPSIEVEEIKEQQSSELLPSMDAGIHQPFEAEKENIVENKLQNDLAAIKSAFNKPIDDAANQTLSFETEPYYTIDYFASQGIKFDYTKEPQDKLTAKMLKFTDWLKKMKTSKPEINITVDDPELDKAIQNIAITSNQSKEVVTETMAEIFAKQGKTEKAIQLYIKLSFLIPDKSAYFATKIKELKGI